MERPLWCRLFHMRSGHALIAIDEEGRRWCVWEWECECGKTYEEGFLVTEDVRVHAELGDAIAAAVVDGNRAYDAIEAGFDHVEAKSW